MPRFRCPLFILLLDCVRNSSMKSFSLKGLIGVRICDVCKLDDFFSKFYMFCRWVDDESLTPSSYYLELRPLSKLNAPFLPSVNCLLSSTILVKLKRVEPSSLLGLSLRSFFLLHVSQSGAGDFSLKETSDYFNAKFCLRSALLFSSYWNSSWSLPKAILVNL